MSAKPASVKGFPLLLSNVSHVPFSLREERDQRPFIAALSPGHCLAGLACG